MQQHSTTRRLAAYYFALDEACRILYTLTGQPPTELRARLIQCGLDLADTCDPYAQNGAVKLMEKDAMAIEMQRVA